MHLTFSDIKFRQLCHAIPVQDRCLHHHHNPSTAISQFSIVTSIMSILSFVLTNFRYYPISDLHCALQDHDMNMVQYSRSSFNSIVQSQYSIVKLQYSQSIVVIVQYSIVQYRRNFRINELTKGNFHLNERTNFCITILYQTSFLDKSLVIDCFHTQPSLRL